jgi:hypothetical protein
VSWLAGGEEQLLQRLPTVAQLRYSCCLCLIKTAQTMSSDQQHPLADELPEVARAAARSARVLQQLEPNKPATHLGAAVCLQMGGGDVRAAVEAYLRMFELGQQQRSDYWTVQGAGAALLIAFQSPLKVGHDILAAALAAFQQTGEAAPRRCSRLLPEQRVLPLRRLLEMVRPLLPGVRVQLRLLQQQASGNPAASAAATSALQAAAEREHWEAVVPRFFDAAHVTDCDGCGQRAEGLRRCARCRRARYCRYG